MKSRIFVTAMACFLVCFCTNYGYGQTERNPVVLCSPKVPHTVLFVVNKVYSFVIGEKDHITTWIPSEKIYSVSVDTARNGKLFKESVKNCDVVARKTINKIIIINLKKGEDLPLK